MKKIQQYNYHFLSALLVFMPLQNLFSNLLTTTGLPSGEAFWIVHWYEPLIVILMTLYLIDVVKRKSVSFIEILAVILLIFGIISAVFLSPNLSQGLEGFRFSLFYIPLFLIAYRFNLSDKEKASIINIYIWIAIAISLWAILERFLPSLYWSVYHITGKDFGFGNDYAGKFIRSASLIGAPNQLGSYLIPGVILTLEQIKNKKHPVLYLLPFIMALAIVLTFSRAAILGLFVSLVIYGFWRLKDIKKIVVAFICIAICTFIGFLVIKSNSSLYSGLITHNDAKPWHSIAIIDSINDFNGWTIQQKLFGKGLGTAGPIALKYQGMVAESWYIQLLQEIGIIGLAIWVLLFAKIAVDLHRKKQPVIFGMVGILVVAAFLHPFADNPAMTYSLLTLIGIGTSHEFQKK